MDFVFENYGVTHIYNLYRNLCILFSNVFLEILKVRQGVTFHEFTRNFKEKKKFLSWIDVAI